MDPIKTKCYCPPIPNSDPPEQPHEFDEFELVDGEHLPIPAGVAASGALSTMGNATGDEIVGVLIDAFLRFGAIKSWNLVDDKGKDVPINPATVTDRLTWVKGGIELTNAAIAAYVNRTTLAPFGLGTSEKKTAKSSPGGRTARSTSAKTSSSLRHLERSA